MKLFICTLPYHNVPIAAESRKALKHLDDTYNMVITYDPALEDPLDRITWRYQTARNWFLSTEADLFVSIEDDMVVPPDTLERLIGVLNAGANIAYGLYAWRHNLPNPDWNAHLAIARPGVSLRRFPKYATECWGSTIDVAGLGLGCTAIKREVLEQIRFERRGPEGCDFYFALDAIQAGFIQRCDLGLICGHYLVYEGKPAIVYPALNEFMCRVVVL